MKGRSFTILSLVLLFVALLTVPAIAENNSRSDQRAIRDALFKCKTLLNRNHNPIHYNLLKNIDFYGVNGAKIPSLALCSIKHSKSSSKFDREMFIKAIVSSINCVNKIIFEHREFVIGVKNKKEPLTQKEKEHFDMICSFYQTKKIDELLEKIAPIPISLAVAQAALESGFGSCKYIHANNTFFGMMKNRTQLYSFDTLFESVIAYAKTLNVNVCYRKFRKERAFMMNSSKKVDGVRLSGFLEKYYESKIYRRQVLALIKEYNLSSLDQNYRKEKV